jgi:lipopolysaccharide cholinephosphotransferase
VYETLVETLLNDGGNFAFSRSLTEDFVYSIFHKIRLSNLIKKYNEKSTEKNKILLKELFEKYGADNTDIFVDNPSYQQKKERSAFVKGLQKYTLETLILTKNFLESHGLRFYLTEGTLLGAVRHNGFIPWDDDIDIAMPREDYDRLVELAKQGEIPIELNFDSLETNPKHWVLGAKMQLVRKTPYIQHKVTKLSKCNGPYVDIFPIDYWNRPCGLKYAVANNCVKVARRLLFIKTGYSAATKKKPFRIIAKIFLPFIKNSWIEKFAIKNMKKFNRGNRKYAVNLCSYYPYYKEVFPTSFWGEPVYLNFEGVQMPVPCEYDYMLKTVYGKNYDTIPPVRVTNMRKHAFELNKEII